MKSYHQIYDEVLTIERDAIGKLLDTLDRAVMDRIVDLLRTVKQTDKKVITAGCGTSGIAAEKIAHTLSVIEVPSFFLSPAHSVHGGMGAISAGDAVVLLSKGGNTEEIASYIPVCKAKGAVIIGITQREGSTLGRAADLLFKMPETREACPWDLIASASILAVLAAFDAIVFAVMQHTDFTKGDFYRIHPGGAAGETLRVGGMEA